MTFDRSTISSRLVAFWKEQSDVPVADARIGLGYTAVLLASGELGLAYTFRDEVKTCCTAFRGPRPLAGRPAGELLPLLESESPLEAGVGLACANALAARRRALAPQNDGQRLHGGDVLEEIDVQPEDQVAMVGHFEPLVEGLRRRVRSLTVFERLSEPDGDLRPAREAIALLPTCQVALITSTSIINHSVDELLGACAGCREVVLLGPSTPLLPEVFLGTAVTLLSGVQVVQAARVLQAVSEGGGMSEFRPHVRKVNIRLERPPDGRTEGRR